MPDPTDQTDKLEALFRGQYARPTDLTDDVLTTEPGAMRAALDEVVAAVDSVHLPALDDALRTRMTGQITPNQRELMIDLIGVLIGDDAKDIVAELGFGAELFRDILDKDIDLENLGGALDDLARAFVYAENMHNRSLGALNAKVLLAVGQAAEALDPVTQLTERNDLKVPFNAAFARQIEMFARQPGSSITAADPEALPKTLHGLKQHLDSVTKDATVMKNLNSIAAAARNLERQGTVLLPPGLK